jgi:uncharacterized membrane protein
LRDIEALLNSFVNIDRNSLIAILCSEADAARQLANAIDRARLRSAQKRRDAEQHAARLDRMLLFFQRGDIAPGMSQRDIKLCKITEQKLRAWGQPRDLPLAGC